jgi:hypothetical protein
MHLIYADVHREAYQNWTREGHLKYGYAGHSPQIAASDGVRPETSCEAAKFAKGSQVIVLGV